MFQENPGAAFIKKRMFIKVSPESFLSLSAVLCNAVLALQDPIMPAGLICFTSGRLPKLNATARLCEEEF